MYPDPRRKRKVWQTLNGEWEFRFGDDKTNAYPLKINVPYAYQCKASGICEKKNHDIICYKKTFALTEEMQRCKTVRLNFLAVDYACEVYVNGSFAIYHEGGYDEFGADVRPYLKTEGEQTVELRVYDPMTKIYPRGKQNWQEEPQRCWYYSTSGIWQSVWLDGTNGDYITDVQFITDAENTQVCAYAETEYAQADEIVACVKTPRGAEQRFSSTARRGERMLLNMAFEKSDCVDDVHLWTAEHPNLYEAKVQIRKNGEVLDEIETYFAFRTIRTENGKVYINDRPIEFRLILNQGYWKDCGMTAPDTECFKNDVLAAKAMGFNGMRMHQKIENPWLYYYADTLGFYIWAEMPSAYDFQPKTTAALMQTQARIVKRMYNHPCVTTYVPFNESWGIKEVLHDKKQQALAKSAYWLIKSLDDTRLVVTNDGWENLEDSDLIGIHDYSKFGDEFCQKFGGITDKFREDTVPASRRVMALGNGIGTQPVIISEFGGVALSSDSGWGYNGAERDEDSFMSRFERLFDNVSRLNVCGWCYTQFTDVEQETNGLLNAEHKPKFDVKKVREVINKYGRNFY